MAFRYTWLPTIRVTSLSNLFSLITQAIWFSRHRCSIVTYFRCIWNGSQSLVQMSFKSIGPYARYALERIWYGIEQTFHLPRCRMLDLVLDFSLRAAGIVVDFIHLRHPILPVSRLSIFSFLFSIYCHAFRIKKRSLLLSRLYVSIVFRL